MSDTYKDIRRCNNCDDDTEHFCRDSDHERDDSNDYEECLKCGWWMTGMDRVQSPPFRYEED